MSFYEINKYDNNNKWISTKRYDKFNALIKESSAKSQEKLYKTNKADFWYSYGLPYEGFNDIEYYSSGEVRKWHYVNEFNQDVYQSYDKKGNLVKIEIYEGGDWIDTLTWIYREDGVLVEESESTSRVVGLPYYKKTTSYKIDYKGNWIEKIIIDSEGNVLDHEMREFEYY